MEVQGGAIWEIVKVRVGKVNGSYCLRSNT